MTAVDKAAIAWTIGIVAVGVAIAGMGGQLTAPSTTQTSAPVIEQELAVTQQPEPTEAAMPEMEEKEPMKEVMEEEPMMEEPMMEEPSGPVTVEVSMPAGTAVPGCEETNECFIPPSVSINVGDTVVWINDDTAAHTVTSGSPTDGPSGVFDSSLLIAGGTYEHTFDSPGTVDYFCMVHPWMVGDVQVS